MFCSIDPSDLCAKNYITNFSRIRSLADNVYEYYNILLPRNYKAWLQSSSAVEASLALEHTKWQSRTQSNACARARMALA
jgi:hypothetical protein